MIRKIVNLLSATAMTVLAMTAMIETHAYYVQASGTNQVAVMTLGTTAVSETLRSDEGVGQMAYALAAIVAASLIIGHAAGGLFGVLVAVFGIGLMMQGREAIEGMGITAAGL